MKIALFYHSLLSDWNHGNAHFLRGYATELQRRGHAVCVYEPRDGWSLSHLLREHGDEPVRQFRKRFSGLENRFHSTDTDLEGELEEMDLVIVHEWNPPDLVRRIGAIRRTLGGFKLLFHDTHHRSVTRPEEMGFYDLSEYDGVLAFGERIRGIYRERGWAARIWTWHEAADTRVFRPVAAPTEGDLVWIGNWGDGERTDELETYLIRPTKDLGLRGRLHGVRYPLEARRRLKAAGLHYAGWAPNFQVPGIFGRFRFTVHIPRRPYVEALPGIPTIRPFEAMACGIPLICSPWEDAEDLFRPGEDYLVARDGIEMRNGMRALVGDRDFAERLADHGRKTILERHTCVHRVDELLGICRELGLRVEAGGRTLLKATVEAEGEQR